MFKTVYQKLFSRSFRRNFKRAIIDLKALPFHRDLNKLGKIYQTDKVGEHFYTQHYMHHFRKFKYKKFNFLEIGVGGYDKPLSGGKSLRMWKRYFPFAKIFSFDIFDKSQLQEKRIRILQGSQIDNQFLDQVIARNGFSRYHCG